MKLCRFIRYGAIFILLMVQAGSINGCTEAGIKQLPEIDNPSRLPYRFLRSGFLQGEQRPIKLEPSGTLGAYNIQNNWRPPDTVSSILFRWLSLNRDHAISQFNAFVPRIFNCYTADLDRDQIEEVAIIYFRGDSMYCEVLNPFQGRLQKMPLIIGQDRNNSGCWDGEGYICNNFDVNIDGFAELFISIQTGYDIYPRKLVCLDWKNGRQLWEFDIPGFISYQRFHIVQEPESGEHLLIFGAGSSCNGAVANEMDDCHSYLVCMNVQGTLIWKRTTGDIFTHTHPLLVDYDNDGLPEILSSVFPKTADSSIVRNLILCNLDGNTLDSLVFDGMISHLNDLDYDCDGKKEVFLTFTDHTVRIMDPNLQQIVILKYDADLYFEDSYDFLKMGKPQLLARSSGGLTILFSQDFRPLAALDQIGKLTVFKSDSLQYNLTIGNEIESYSYLLIKSPWYSIFVRYPFFSFLSGFIPLAILVSIIWLTLLKFRQKNRTILLQRDYLDVTLTELRETQQRLIEYEKYKQTKDIAGGFAHEIRNALFPAKASLSKIAMANQSQENRAEVIAKFTNLADLAIAKAIDVTNQISDYVRLESMHRPESVRISQVVREVLETNQLRLMESEVKITTNGPEEICIESNHRQFFSVINNLLLNSLDALAGKADNRISIDWQRNSAQVILRFADNGRGIPEAIRSTIFDAFRSYKEQKGIGLGLAIVKRIIEMYEGTITVESVPGQGTIFSLLLKESGTAWPNHPLYPSPN